MQPSRTRKALAKALSRTIELEGSLVPSLLDNQNHPAGKMDKKVPILDQRPMPFVDAYGNTISQNGLLATIDLNIPDTSAHIARSTQTFEAQTGTEHGIYFRVNPTSFSVDQLSIVGFGLPYDSTNAANDDNLDDLYGIYIGLNSGVLTASLGNLSGKFESGTVFNIPTSTNDFCLTLNGDTGQIRLLSGNTATPVEVAQFTPPTNVVTDLRQMTYTTGTPVASTTPLNSDVTMELITPVVQYDGVTWFSVSGDIVEEVPLEPQDTYAIVGLPNSLKVGRDTTTYKNQTAVPQPPITPDPVTITQWAGKTDSGLIVINGSSVSQSSTTITTGAAFTQDPIVIDSTDHSTLYLRLDTNEVKLGQSISLRVDDIIDPAGSGSNDPQHSVRLLCVSTTPTFGTREFSVFINGNELGTRYYMEGIRELSIGVNNDPDFIFGIDLDAQFNAPLVVFTSGVDGDLNKVKVFTRYFDPNQPVDSAALSIITAPSLLHANTKVAQYQPPAIPQPDIVPRDPLEKTEGTRELHFSINIYRGEAVDTAEFLRLFLNSPAARQNMLCFGMAFVKTGPPRS